MANEDRPTTEAIDWLMRQRDPAFADWERFTEWLEASSANSDAFSRLSAIDAAVAERLTSVPALRIVERQDSRAASHKPWRSRRGMLAAAGAAAAAIALLVVPSKFMSTPELYAVSTPAGIRQTITLAGGTTVSVNGNTRMLFDRDNPRFAKLIYGEASFDIVHDASKPFRVEVAGARLIDIGTRFNVLQLPDSTRVAVAEGAVEYSLGGAMVQVAAGQELRASQNELHLSKIDPSTVGAWREGRLIYQGDPLSVVAQDLSRNLGRPVTVDPSIATLPVTAVVQLPDKPEQLPRTLERLLGIKVRKNGEGWLLTAAE